MEDQTLISIANIVVLLITASILVWYSLETRWLRQEMQRQVEAANRQIKVSQYQLEVMQRPFIVIDPVWGILVTKGDEKRILRFVVRNAGTSAVVNVDIIRDGKHRIKIPLIDSHESVEVSVCEDGVDPFHYFPPSVSNPISEYIFFLDVNSITDGLNLKIEYCNVAMMQYSTTQKILPNIVLIESSGKMGPYVYSPRDIRT